MACLYPSEALGVARSHGHLRPGARADFAHLTDTLELGGTWIAGARPIAPARDLQYQGLEVRRAGP